MGPSLSRREIEVLRHVALGETSKEIAGALASGNERSTGIWSGSS